MPTYSMAAPNGQTYQIDGPEGANDDQVRAEILRQHPDAGAAPEKAGTDWLGLAGRAVMQGADDIKGMFQEATDKLLPSLPGARSAGNAVASAVTGRDALAGNAQTGADQMRLPTPQTTPERLFSKGVEYGTAALAGTPEVAEAKGAAAALAALKTAATGAGSGLASQGAAEAGAPEWLQNVAAVTAGAAPTGAKLAAHPLAKALAPFVAPMSKAATEAAAAAKLASAATDPAAVVAALDQPGEIVPGSKPTTFQQTGDAGLGQLERQAATADPAAFQERAAEQNSARRAALSGVETGGDPNDVAKALKQQFDDLNGAHDAKVQEATQAAQDKAGVALGPEEHADAIGADLRQALDEANTSARASENALWKAVDPEGTMVGNASTTVQAAHEIPGEIAKTAKPMQGEEAGIFDAAQNLSPLSPLQDLIALRSRVSAEMRQQTGPQGDPQALRRLTMLRGAIEDNLAHTISQEIANDAAKAKAGIIEPSDVVASRLQSWLHDWQAGRQSGPTGGASVSVNPAEGSAGGAGVLRTESPAPQGSGSPAVASGVPQPAVFDQAARERLNAASASTAQRAQTFKNGPVGDVLAAKGGKGQYRLPDGQVAAKFFKPDATGFARMQALLATGAQDALQTIERFAAHTLRRAALRPDGTLDPAKFAKWQKSYADSLRALPEDVRAKYADAARASETLADAEAERTEALKAAQQGAIGKIMGLSEPEDVVKRIGQVLNGSTPIADMKALARATAGDPVARQGLRRAITDYIASKFVGNTEAGTSGEAKIKADAYQTFVRQNRSALHLVFSPEEVRSMEAVAEDLQRAARSQNSKLPGGSNTAQDINSHLKAIGQVAQRSWLEIIGGALGATHGPLGAALGIGGAHLIRSLRAAGVSRIDQLVSKAMLEPAVARQLLKKAPQNTANWTAATAPLTAALWSAGQTKKDDNR